jgi:hypothetical protein
MTEYQSFMNEDKPQLFKVEIPDVKAVKLMKLNVNSTVGDLAANIATKINLQHAEDYGFECQNVLLEHSKLLSFYNLPPETVLKLRKRIQRIELKAILIRTPDNITSSSSSGGNKNNTTTTTTTTTSSDVIKLFSITVPWSATVGDVRKSLLSLQDFPRNWRYDATFALYLRTSDSPHLLLLEDPRRMVSYRLKPTDVVEYRGMIEMRQAEKRTLTH